MNNEKRIWSDNDEKMHEQIVVLARIFAKEYRLELKLDANNIFPRFLTKLRVGNMEFQQLPDIDLDEESKLQLAKANSKSKKTD